MLAILSAHYHLNVSGNTNRVQDLGNRIPQLPVVSFGTLVYELGVQKSGAVESK
jgi:hypothetical protein